MLGIKCSNKHISDYLSAFIIVLSWEESVLLRHFCNFLGVKNKICYLLTTEDGVECPHCDRVFKNQYMLDEHIHIHTGEKRYKCEMCEKLYSTRESLRSHMKGHQFQFGCEICAKPLGSYSAFMWVKLFTRDCQFFDKPHQNSISSLGSNGTEKDASQLTMTLPQGEGKPGHLKECSVIN